jgi:hypothetical protein
MDGCPERAGSSAVVITANCAATQELLRRTTPKRVLLHCLLFKIYFQDFGDLHSTSPQFKAKSDAATLFFHVCHFLGTQKRKWNNTFVLKILLYNGTLFQAGNDSAGSADSTLSTPIDRISCQQQYCHLAVNSEII